jgi:hypothetical protein
MCDGIITVNFSFPNSNLDTSFFTGLRKFANDSQPILTKQWAQCDAAFFVNSNYIVYDVIYGSVNKYHWNAQRYWNAHIIKCLMYAMTTDMVWIGNWIYLTFTFPWRLIILSISLRVEMVTIISLILKLFCNPRPDSQYPLVMSTSPLFYTKFKVISNRRSVGQSLLVSCHHLRPATTFSVSSIEILFRQLCLLGVALSEEKSDL